MADPWMPPDDWGWGLVRWARFLNVLDDARNVLSPVKINTWAANLATVWGSFAAILAWVSGHFGMLQHVLDVGPLIGGWMAQAHITHHMDKRERNLQAARMKD